MSRWTPGLALLALGAWGCATTDTACEPGSVAECLGLGRCPGVQSCTADGSGYGPCECGVELDPSRDPVGAAAGCLEQGAFDCGLSDRCCAGATCVTARDADGLEFSVCAGECTTRSECESNCCSAYDGSVRVCSPPDRCEQSGCQVNDECSTGCCISFACAPSAACGPSITLPSVLGADGAFLGVASGDPSIGDGVCNPSGPHGSSTSASSIFNPTGPYGSPDSSLSAYNPSTVTPPFLYDPGAPDFTINDAIRVTRNQAFLTGVDPDDLCFYLAPGGF